MSRSTDRRNAERNAEILAICAETERLMAAKTTTPRKGTTMDYRQFEHDAQQLDKRIRQLVDKGERRTAQDEADIAVMSGEAKALHQAALQVQAAELADLKAMAARVAPAGDGVYRAPAIDSGEMRDFYAYMRSGDAALIRNTSMSTTDGNGGFLVPEPEHAALIEHRRLIDPILARATHFDMNGDTTMQLPFKATHGVAAVATELEARTEQTEPTLTSASLIAYDYYSDQRASMQLVDSIAGFDALMLRWLGEDVLETYGADIAVGNGSNKPTGLFSATGVYTTTFSGSASSILNTTPAKMFFTLPSRYRPQSAWICNSATIAVLCGFASPANADQPLVDQSGDTFKMMGKPILECESAPALSAGNYALAFGDIGQAYVVGTHRRLSVLVDDYTAPPKRRWYALARLAGAPWNPEAMVLCRAATV